MRCPWAGLWYWCRQPGARSYEAQIALKQAGAARVLHLHGGIAALKQSGIDI